MYDDRYWEFEILLEGTREGHQEMVTFSDALSLVHLGRHRGGLILDCDDAIQRREVAFLGPIPGTASAADAAAMYEIRLMSSVLSDANVIGLKDAITALRSIPPDERVSLFHFRGSGRLYTALITSESRTLLACIRVDSKTSK